MTEEATEKVVKETAEEVTEKSAKESAEKATKEKTEEAANDATKDSLGNKGTGNSVQIPRTGAEWNDYYKSKYGDGNVTWVTELKSYDDILNNPKALWGKSADEVGRALGDGWTKGTYGSAGTGWKFTNGDKSVF